MSEFFPPFIRALPAPDSPVRMDAQIVPSEHVLTMFYEIDDDRRGPRARHGAQWGVVLAGAMELEIDGTPAPTARATRTTSPTGALHTARISRRLQGHRRLRRRRPLCRGDEGGDRGDGADARAGRCGAAVDELRARRCATRQVVRTGTRHARRVVRGRAATCSASSATTAPARRRSSSACRASSARTRRDRPSTVRPSTSTRPRRRTDSGSRPSTRTSR